MIEQQEYRAALALSDLVGTIGDAPAVTKSFILIMGAIHLIVHCSGRPQRDEFVRAFGLHKQSVVKAGQWHRLWTHALVHVNLAHLGFNMYTFQSFGSVLETRLGKSKYAFTLLAGILMSSIIDISLGLLMDMLLKGSRNVISCGFSGVIFHLIVIEYLTRNKYDSVSIRDIARKFVKMLLMNHSPGASFVGHLSGVLSGVVQVLAMNLWNDIAQCRAWSRALLLRS